MNISNVINNSRANQSNTPLVNDNNSQQYFERSEEIQSCGCPFAGKHEQTTKEENTVADLLLAISNILRRLLA